MKKCIAKFTATALAFMCAVATIPISTYAVSNYVNVTSLGANGKDKKSDTLAIQQALNKARDAKMSNNEQYEVYVPAGTYYIDNTLRIYSDTKLVLNGKAIIMRSDESRPMLTNASDSGYDVGKYGRSKNISIIGGTWNGNVKTQKYDAMLMKIYHAKKITLKNTTVKNYCGGHDVIFDAVADSVVDNCTFSDFKYYKGNMSNYSPYDYGKIKSTSERMRKTESLEALHLDFVTNEQDFVQSYPLDKTPCKNVSVTSCTFKNVPSGCGTHHNPKGLYADKMNFSNNKFINVWFRCIAVFNFSNFTVKNNTATKCGCLLYANGSSGNVSSNKVSLITSLTSKHYKDCGFSGININDHSKVSCISNTINGGVKHGIIVSVNSSATIKSNKITGTKGHGIYLHTNSRATVSKNTFTKCLIDGMYVTNNSTANVSNNTFNSIGRTGIQLTNGGKGTYSSNRIYNPKAHGIIVNNSKGVTLTKNTVTNPSGMGIYMIKNVSATVSGNKISGAKTHGISAYDKSSVTISGNTISSSTSHGIYIANSSYGIVTNNFVSKSGHNGIFFYNKSRGKISGNSVVRTYGYRDILISGSSKNITVSSNGLDGKGVGVDGSSYASISGNKLAIAGCSIYLSKTSYKYTGKAIKPTVTVKQGYTTLKRGSSYTVTYKSNKKVGTASVVIAGKGKYICTKTLTFKIHK